MNTTNEPEAQEGFQETRLVSGKETAHQPNAYSNSSQPSNSSVSSEENEQVGGDRNNAQRTNGTDIRKRSRNPGKIAEHLKLIEQAFLSYVNGHQQRLEARLDESKQAKEEFLSAVKELESEINSLISQESQESEPPSEEP